MQFRSSVVRHLAWALSSPPLLAPSKQDQISWPEPAWFQDYFHSCLPALAELDADPTPLQEFLAGENDKRLGHYFESLWAYSLNIHPRYTLLARNLQIRSGATTHGEFDLIVEDRIERNVQHWELAVKFYLGFGDTRQLTHWTGTDRRDRLHRKLAHLCDNQLQLDSNRHARQALDEAGLTLDGHTAIVKGRLFYPAYHQGPPAQAAAEHLRGYWLTLEDFVDRFEHSSLCWKPIEKLQWLGPLQGRETVDAFPTAAMARRLERTGMPYPVCLAGIAARTECLRVFLVPQGWMNGIEAEAEK